MKTYNIRIESPKGICDLSGEKLVLRILENKQDSFTKFTKEEVLKAYSPIFDIIFNPYDKKAVLITSKKELENILEERALEGENR